MRAGNSVPNRCKLRILSGKFISETVGFCGGASEEPDVFEDQITEIRPDAEDAGVEIDFDGIQASVGSWNAHRVERGGALPGPISHVYVANLCM